MSEIHRLQVETWGGLTLKTLGVAFTKNLVVPLPLIYKSTSFTGFGWQKLALLDYLCHYYFNVRIHFDESVFLVGDNNICQQLQHQHSN